MASRNKIHPSNVSGSLFVDLTCIDCGTCFHLGPSLFEEALDEKSFVKGQPVTHEEWLEAKRAILSCPTNSIGVMDSPKEFRETKVLFPMLISDNVYYCGYTSKNSFGASSFFIERAEGNVMIDSPRFNLNLANEIEAMGGISTMILTHIDDVADHEKWHEHFGCERIIDRKEGLHGLERELELTDPYSFDNELLILPTPGHTQGHLVVLYRNKFLFTGDHLFFDTTNQQLTSSHSVCWHDWKTQIESTRQLRQYEFEWIMPGHGGWGRIRPESKNLQLNDLIQRMEKTS